MFIYWGGVDSGKSHIRSFARLNSKTQLLWTPLFIVKVITQNHIHEDTWRDETSHQIIYHNVDDEFRICEKKEDRVWRLDRFNDVHERKMIKSLKKNKTRYSDEHCRKYTQKEYIGTSVYFDIIKRPYLKILKELNSDILKDHWDEIIDGVDIISFQMPEWVIKDLVEIVRKSTNIIPYKSDLVDECVSKLDGFSYFRRESEYGNDVLEVYDQDKNRVWRWLDSFQEEVEGTKKMFKKYEIPYEMFDLDQDSYTDFFGWELDMDRKYSWRGKNWVGERHEKIVSIAKEYIQLRY